MKDLEPVRYKYIQPVPTPTCFNLFQLILTYFKLLTINPICSNLLQHALTCSNLFQPAPHALSTIVRINSVIKLLKAILVIHLSFVKKIKLEII